MPSRDPLPDDLFSGFEEIFGDLFANAPRGLGHAALGHDTERRLVLDLEEVSEGAQRELEITRVRACPACRGRGALPGEIFERCAGCEGRGGKSEVHGVVTVKTTCDRCNGTGGRWQNPCAACLGSRGEATTERVVLTVPPGLREGQRLRLAGKGNVIDGRAGDLYVTVFAKPDPRFTREGADLRTRLPLRAELAREGGLAVVPMLRGTRRVAVPPGTRSGQEVRLPGCGMVKPGAPVMPLPVGDDVPYRSTDASQHRGDVIVTFEVEGDPLPDPHLDTEEADSEMATKVASAAGSDGDAASDARFRWVAAGVGVTLVLAWLASRLWL